ncbi:MAG: glycosyltransferase family 39 protein [Thermoanaerobaculum sp.]
MGFRFPWWVPAALAAFGVRVAAAFSLRPWHDEYFTAWASSLPWGEMVAALGWDSGPPLPYVLAKLLSLAGIPPLWAARGVSVVSGTAAVIFVGLAARGAFGKTQGVLASWLLAFHPLAVLWSAEGRAYGLLGLWVAATLWVCSLASPDRRRWLWLALFLTAGVYTHALGLAWLLVVFLYGVVRREKPAICAAGAALAAFLPWVSVTAQQPPEAVAWMVWSLAELPSWTRWLGAWRLLPPMAGWGLTLEAPTPPAALQLGAAFLTVSVLVWARGWPWFLAGLPAAGLTAGGLLGVPVYYPGRGEAIVLPAFALLVVSGLETFRRQVAGWLLVAFGAAGSVWAVGYLRASPPRPEERVATFLRGAPAGVLVTTGWWWLGMRYHLPPSWAVRHVPAAALVHPGWFAPGREPVSEAEVASVFESLSRAEREGREAALLVTPGLAEARALQHQAQALGWRRVLVVPGGELWAPGRKNP